jgi:hypothetical protein
MEYTGPTLESSVEAGVIDMVGPPLLTAMSPPNDVGPTLDDGDGGLEYVVGTTLSRPDVVAVGPILE